MKQTFVIAIFGVLLSCSGNQNRSTQTSDLNTEKQIIESGKYDFERIAKSMTEKDRREVSGLNDTVEKPTGVGSYSSENSNIAIQVRWVLTHNFLAEFDKYLVLEKEGKILEQEKLYPDSGSEDYVNLYKVSNGIYLVIDSNGFWYRVDYENKKINNEGFNWEETPDGKYIGCFDMRDDKFGYFDLTTIEERSPYLYKDLGGP